MKSSLRIKSRWAGLKKSCLSALMTNERGGALIYILIAIALLAALTASFVEPSSQQSRAQNSFKLAAEISSQVQVIRSSVQNCILLYPAGDSTINDGTTTDTGYHAPYPLNPDSTHLPTTPAFRAADRKAMSMRCPGQNGGPGSEDEHAAMFGASSGTFLPAIPSLFEDWVYFNGSGTIDGDAVDGVYFMVSTTRSDPYLGEALQKVEGKLSSCEADYIVGDGTNGCALNSKCLRVWVKRSSSC